MSKTIEFVEKEKEYTKKNLERLEIDLNFPFRKEVITHLKENLQTLEQIKCELEAWEVVKPYIEIVEDMGVYYWNTKPNYEYCELKDYETIKKALVVKDE